MSSDMFSMPKPPEKKKSRRDERDDSMVSSHDSVSNDVSLFGFIHFEANVTDITPDGISSPVIEVQGTPWKLSLSKLTRLDVLAVFLSHRKSESDSWSIDVACELKLVNTHHSLNIKKKIKKTYNHKSGAWGRADFITWEDLVNEEKGFIKDGKIIVEARFMLSNFVGIRVTKPIDFFDYDDPRHDVELLIDGKPIYASKQILAVHSPVFNEMFFGDFVENENEIELYDLDIQEFIDMLNMIYPTDEKVTDANVNSLLKLADRFQIKKLLDQVEQFLIDSTKMTVPWKLKLSGEFRLVKLQDHCLISLKTVEDIQDLSTMDGYELLSEKTKATLLDKVMKLRQPAHMPKSPEKKKSRREEPDASLLTSNNDPSSGFIHFEVNVSDITEKGVYSPVIEVHGLPWKLIVRKVTDKSSLGVLLLHRKSDSAIWSIDVSCEFKLVNARSSPNITRKLNATYNHEYLPAWGWPDFIKWEDLINEEKGFIKDGKIIVEARFTLTKIVGIRVTRSIDFSDSEDRRHDVALLIEGEKIYVNKGILAVHSPVFDAMFFGDFAEKKHDEIELKDIDHKEFIEMLNLIYPTDRKINDVNVESLLKLADRFQIKSILDQVEQFLIDSTKLTIPWKLKLSDEFRLVKLQDHCLDSLKSSEDIKNLKTIDGYKELSNDIKAILLEKMMNLV